MKSILDAKEKGKIQSSSRFEMIQRKDIHQQFHQQRQKK